MADRTASIERRTSETDIRLALNLDGTGQAEIRTGVGFLDHMLEQVVRHGLFDLEVGAEGDVRVDAHHTVEDVGIALGQAVRDAVGDKRGIQRYGHAYVPLDEALSRVVVDLSGRPGLQFNAAFPRARVGEFDVELVPEFFRGWANHAPATLHVDNLRGANTHHIVETLFKAFGRALRVAVEQDPRMEGVVPSTKGSL